MQNGDGCKRNDVTLSTFYTGFRSSKKILNKIEQQSFLFDFQQKKFFETNFALESFLEHLTDVLLQFDNGSKRFAGKKDEQAEIYLSLVLVDYLNI